MRSGQHAENARRTTADGGKCLEQPGWQALVQSAAAFGLM
jgi:hypothetical protein